MAEVVRRKKQNFRKKALLITPMVRVAGEKVRVMDKHSYNMTGNKGMQTG